MQEQSGIEVLNKLGNFSTKEQFQKTKLLSQIPDGTLMEELFTSVIVQTLVRLKFFCLNIDKSIALKLYTYGQ